MKIKSNIRAGKGGATGGGKNSPNSVDISNVVITYVKSISRCVGI